MSNIKKFNNLLGALIKLVIRTCPDDTNVKIGQTKFETGKSIDPFLPWKLFVKYCDNDEYRDIILNKNESFFLDQEIDDEYVNSKVSEGENPVASLRLIKSAWENTFDDKQKSAVWASLANLYSISDVLRMEKANLLVGYI